MQDDNNVNDPLDDEDLDTDENDVIDDEEPTPPLTEDEDGVITEVDETEED